MARTIDTGKGCRNATKAFAVAGDRRPSHCLADGGAWKSLYLIVATALLPAAVNATPGTVEISVTVAPRYKVLALELAESASVRLDTRLDRLCLVTNSLVPTMAVVVPRTTRQPNRSKSRSREEEQFTEGTATQIRPCGLMKIQPRSHAIKSLDQPANQPLLIRPE